MLDFIAFDFEELIEKLENKIISTIKSVLRENGKMGETIKLKQGYDSSIDDCPIYLNRVCLIDDDTLAFGGEVIREYAQELWVSLGHKVSTMPNTLIPQKEWLVDIRELNKILFEIEIICKEVTKETEQYE